MPNTIKLETQDQSIHQSTQEQLLSDNYQRSVPCDWTSYERHMYLRVCVSRVRTVMFYIAAEVHKMQSLIKTTSSDQMTKSSVDGEGITGPPCITFSET